MSSMIYRLLGSAAFAVGAVGMFLPLLPTVPLWILAAWCFARSAPDLRDRIYAHPRFGRQVRDFLEHGVLDRRGKAYAVTGVSLGVGVSVIGLSPPPLVTAILVAVVLAVVGFLLTRPATAPEPNQNLTARSKR
jgi:uncharacterized membrane protein YbaN (DUF454 family)